MKSKQHKQKQQSPRDIDDVLAGWEHRPGRVCARMIEADDGRDVLQMRIELGVLQMESQGRPDGSRPGGWPTYFDFLRAKAERKGESFRLSDRNCVEIDREFLQFYHRRICWLELKEFERAVDDADHTLALMDFVRDRSPDADWTEAHEQYRPFVMFHRAQARALASLTEGDGEAAIELINRGIDELRTLDVVDFDEEPVFEEDEFVERLEELRESIRESFSVGITLKEQLDLAVQREEYELAARLRDQIARRGEEPTA